MGRRLALAAMILIVGAGAVLRLDALAASFGPHAAPRWLSAAEHVSTRVSRLVVPDGWAWPREPNPYAGGDPHNYLRFAREMRHFYQAHVREPVYLEAVRAGLLASGGEDVGISLASITFSLLVLVATYLLGVEAVSRTAGVLAAAALAIDRDAILWSFEGWRAETFTFVSLMAAWFWLRSSRAQTTRSAVMAGIATGLACLTRLTAPFMLAPAVLWTLCARDPVRFRQRVRLALVGGFVAAIIVTPYLVNCAIEFGDPFYAINYHTQYYLDHEGAPPVIMSASRYILDKFAARPVETTDIAIQGLFVYPFQNKWSGLNVWMPGLGTTLSWLSVAGLVWWLFLPRGRFLLGVLLGSLVPFMITWSIPGGSEWRFTFHTYPFYLLAGFGFAGAVAGAVGTLRVSRPPWRRLAVRAALVVLLGAIGIGWWWGTPPLIAREALRQARPVPIMAGPRDRWILRRGWGPLSVTENVTARFSTGSWSEIALPLLEGRAYNLVLRIDPIPRDDLPPRHVRVELNGETLGAPELSWDPAMVGRYEFRVPSRLVRPGTNVLRLYPDALVEAGSAAWRYPVLRPVDRVGFRFWYVLVRFADDEAGLSRAAAE